MHIGYLSAILCLVASTAHAGCAGRDLFADLQQRDPATYAAVEEKAAETPNGEGLLWRIEKDGIKPSYLFGTVHLADPRVVTLVPEVQKAFDSSETLAVELADLDDAALGQKMAQRGFVPTGGTLAGIPEDVVGELGKAAETRGIPPAALPHMQQWFILIALAMPPCIMAEMASRNPEDILDGSLIKKAKTGGKNIVGLETPEEQFRIFEGLDADLVRRGLVLTARFDRRAEDAFETMTQMYLARRIALMETAVPAALGMNADETRDVNYFTRAIMDERNKIMVERGAPHLEKGGVFIAVGAGHLPGSLGVVALLREAGYTLTKLW